MAPKALIFLPLLAPLSLAWGTTHDLYVRDAVPEPNPYAYEQALAARALAARRIYAAKARRAATGQVVLSRQVNPRAAEAKADPEVHAFQQYDAGLFRRDGSVIPRDPYAYPDALALAQPDPEAWFEGGELYARARSDDDDEWEDEEDEKPKKKAGKKQKKQMKNGRNKSRKGARKSKKEGEDDEDDDEEKSEEEDKEEKSESQSKGGKKNLKGLVKSWFNWFRW